MAGVTGVTHAVEFDEFYQGSRHRVVTFLYALTSDRGEAQDVAQEAYARAYQRFRQLRDRERFRAWIVRMTWRLALDRQRGERRRITREQHVAPAPITDTTVADERAALLWQAIDALPEKLRMVTVLAGIEGHDMREVGALLGLPEGTVKSRLFEARRRMKEYLSCTIERPGR